MIKKIFYIIIPLIFISFSQNVKAEETYYIKEYYDTKQKQYVNSNILISSNFINSMFTTDLNSFKNSYTSFNNGSSKMNYVVNRLNDGTFDNYISQYDSYLMYAVDSNNTGGNICFFNKEDAYLIERMTGTLSLSLKNGICYQYNKNQYTTIKEGVYDDHFPYGELYYQYSFKFSNNEVNSLYNSNMGLVYLSDKSIIDYFLGNSKPVLSYSIKPIYKDGYLSSYGIKVNSTIVDDSLYKYQYAIKDNIDDNLNWVDLYNNNFLNNEFSYITKKPIYFYFRVVDKSNNDVIDSFTITITFDLVSPEYDIIFNQSKFYLTGTNIIDRLGLSITYKTSIDGLKYQFQYVNDGSSLSEDMWVDTESDIYRVYDVNGVMYARILDNDNNVLYSATFKNTLIGKQDILDNPSNFPLYNKVQKVLNFNNGSISDIVLIPVKVLMFMSNSLNNNSCTDYSFGSLLNHELKLPCIDIKSYVGNTIYNFYDLVCSFFISLGIVKLLKNIYMRFMTLEIRDIDSKGGIF